MAAGISKRELMEDYFLDELLLVLDASAEISRGAGGAESAEAVSAEDF